MKKVFVTDFDKNKYQPRGLFPLVRPFYYPKTSRWEINTENLMRWNCLNLNIEIADSIDDADFILVSEPLNHHHNPEKYKQLEDLNSNCVTQNIQAYVYIEGDYGKVHPQFSNIVYYRMGGFKTQLDKNNKVLSPMLTDQLTFLFDRNTILLREKTEKPTVGFCGHASVSIPKLMYEKLKLIQLNLNRAFKKDFNWEPLFSSAYERLKILNALDKANEVNTNFIFRGKYRAGSSTKDEQVKTTKEYFNNIVESDYIICLRGSGNFSVRFYETLMMGRIPIFVNTDCLLPFEDEIDWKQHVVWVEWKDRGKVASVISDFHKNISKDRFKEMQLENRNLFLSRLSLKNYLERLTK
jgi:hypothetical protein